MRAHPPRARGDDHVARMESHARARVQAHSPTDKSTRPSTPLSLPVSFAHARPRAQTHTLTNQSSQKFSPLQISSVRGRTSDGILQNDRRGHHRAQRAPRIALHGDQEGGYCATHVFTPSRLVVSPLLFPDPTNPSPQYIESEHPQFNERSMKTALHRGVKNDKLVRVKSLYKVVVVVTVAVDNRVTT